MPIDFAGDLGRIAGDAAGVMVAATYTPVDGGDVATRVLPLGGDRLAEFGMSRISVRTGVFLLPVAAVAAPAEGDTLTVGGVDHVVQGVPQQDPRGLHWIVEARPV